MEPLDPANENYITRRINAEKGISPCGLCTRAHPEDCVSPCYLWELWFRKHWRDIRAAAAEIKK